MDFPSASNTKMSNLVDDTIQHLLNQTETKGRSMIHREHNKSIPHFNSLEEAKHYFRNEHQILSNKRVNSFSSNPVIQKHISKSSEYNEEQLHNAQESIINHKHDSPEKKIDHTQSLHPVTHILHHDYNVSNSSKDEEIKHEHKQLHKPHEDDHGNMFATFEEDAQTYSYSPKIMKLKAEIDRIQKNINNIKEWNDKYTVNKQNNYEHKTEREHMMQLYKDAEREYSTEKDIIKKQDIRFKLTRVKAEYSKLEKTLVENLAKLKKYEPLLKSHQYELNHLIHNWQATHKGSIQQRRNLSDQLFLGKERIKGRVESNILKAKTGFWNFFGFSPPTTQHTGLFISHAYY